MPRLSIEETLKKKIQARALIESGKCKTKKEVLEMTGVAKQTLDAWIKEDADDIWVFGSKVGENRIYDAQKIVQKEKILKQFKKEEEKIKDDIITQKATEDATAEAMVLINLQKERNKLTKEMLESAYIVNQYIIDLVKKGKTARTIEEDVIWEGHKMKDWETGGTLKKQTKTVEEHKIPDIVRAGELLTKQLYGLGVLQQIPAVAIQNNNNNIQNNDTHTQENSILSEYTKKYLQEKENLAPKVVETQEA